MALVEAIPPRIGCKWVFYHDGGERFANVSSRFALYVKKAADPKKGGKLTRRFRLHDLRHRFAYRWLRAGGDIYELSRHLGHANVKVTDQIYGGWARCGSEHGPEQKGEVG
jgi:integrase/recombinase XerD